MVEGVLRLESGGGLPRHVVEPTELTDGEAASYRHEVLRVARAIEVAFAPIKLNYDVLGNSVPHLHTHRVAAAGAARDQGHGEHRAEDHTLPSGVGRPRRRSRLVEHRRVLQSLAAIRLLLARAGA